MSRSAEVSNVARKALQGTYNRWNSEVLLLGVFEQVEHIIADDNAGFAC
jgi:hypothetical protein